MRAIIFSDYVLSARAMIFRNPTQIARKNFENLAASFPAGWVCAKQSDLTTRFQIRHSALSSPNGG